MDSRKIPNDERQKLVTGAHERRRYERFAAHGLTVFLRQRDMFHPLGRVVELGALDYNRYGLGVRCSSALEIGRTIRLELRASDLQIPVTGVVHNCRLIPPSEYRCGVQFRFDDHEDDTGAVLDALARLEALLIEQSTAGVTS